MLTRGQRITVAIILAINVALPFSAIVAFAGPLRLFGVIVVAIEVLVLIAIYRRHAHDRLAQLTPIPPREGSSRSGAPMVEAFFRARDDVRDRYA